MAPWVASYAGTCSPVLWGLIYDTLHEKQDDCDLYNPSKPDHALSVADVCEDLIITDESNADVCPDACTDSTLLVTVTSMSGAAVLGPEALPKDMSMEQLRTRTLSVTETLASSVRLLAGTRELQDYETLADITTDTVALQLNAIFSMGITDKERQDCIDRLQRLANSFYARPMSEEADGAEQAEESEWLMNQITSVFGQFSEGAMLDSQVILKALELGEIVQSFVPESLWIDESFVLEAVRRGYGHCVMGLADDALKSDKRFMMAVVRHHGELFRWAKKQLQFDEDLALAAIGQRSRVFARMPDALKSRRSFVLRAVSQHGDILLHCEDHFKADHEVVLAALQSSPSAFQYAERALRSDKQFVTRAVRLNGCVLRFADSRLLSDEAVVFEAVRQDVKALSYADRSLRANQAFLLRLVAETGEALLYADARLKGDKTVVLHAVSQCGCAIQHAAASLCMDHEVAKAAVTNDRRALAHIHASLQADVLSAVGECVIAPSSRA
jgi:hypothetical protein